MTEFAPVFYLFCSNTAYEHIQLPLLFCFLLKLFKQAKL